MPHSSRVLLTSVITFFPPLLGGLLGFAIVAVVLGALVASFRRIWLPKWERNSQRRGRPILRYHFGTIKTIESGKYGNKGIKFYYFYICAEERKNGKILLFDVFTLVRLHSERKSDISEFIETNIYMKKKYFFCILKENTS